MKKNGLGDLEENHGMKSPSLVARLMGLESTPAVYNKSREDSSEISCFLILSVEKFIRKTTGEIKRRGREDN